MEHCYKEGCIFCKFAKKEIETAIIYENDHIIAFPDINPAGVLLGHTLVVPKKHFDTIDEVEEEYLKEAIIAIKNLTKAIKKMSGAEGINILQNNGKAAGQLIPHVHFHIIPRKHGDGIFFDEKRRKMHPMEQTETAKLIKETIQNQ